MCLFLDFKKPLHGCWKIFFSNLLLMMKKNRFSQLRQANKPEFPLFHHRHTNREKNPQIGARVPHDWRSPLTNSQLASTNRWKVAVVNWNEICAASTLTLYGLKEEGNWTRRIVLPCVYHLNQPVVRASWTTRKWNRKEKTTINFDLCFSDNVLDSDAPSSFDEHSGTL